MAVTLVNKPVKFSQDSYPVRILIALAATDANSHIDVMQVLAYYFCGLRKKIQNMANSKSVAEIYTFLLNEEQERRQILC